MKKSLLIFICAGLMACDNSESETDHVRADSIFAAEDSVNTPGGVINSSPISTDTAAMNVQNAIKAGKDSAK